MQPAVPEYVGTHPYQQVPFQYSLHIKDNPDAELRHEEFLGNPDEDPRRPLAESLVKNIPNDVCVQRVCLLHSVPREPQKPNRDGTRRPYAPERS